MKIFLASDHAGFELKNQLQEFLSGLGYEVLDCGAENYDESDDYPIFIKQAVKSLLESEEGSRAIILGGSGQGEAITANRYKGIRACVYYGGREEIVTLSREHNDANVLSLGARFLDPDEALNMVKLWLETPFSKDERHQRRIEQIDE